MNLEQIVKETVAKIVAEKELTAAEEKKREEIVKAMKKDFKGPAPAMYAIATDKAKKLAEDGFFNPTNQNHQKAAIGISNFLLKNIPQYMSAQDAGKLLQYIGAACICPNFYFSFIDLMVSFINKCVKQIVACLTVLKHKIFI